MSHMMFLSIDNNRDLFGAVENLKSRYSADGKLGSFDVMSLGGTVRCDENIYLAQPTPV